ncbi:MAG: hypothetical protein IPK19_10245 [Chloroflexi bacterium]|nr:hypothetical protein [Chloroflexota bacterium]
MQRANSIQTFIETGTYRGEPSAWAAKYFAEVITIEYAETLYEAARQRFQVIPHVRVLHGHSGVELAKLVPKLSAMSIFWLDSHWSGGETYGSDDECPLMDELQAIMDSPFQHCILIDDARLFLSTPQLPHNPSAWPSISDIVVVLRKEPHLYEIFVIEDNIIAVPPGLKPYLTTYCQRVNTEAWRRYGEENSQNGLVRGLRMMRQGLELVAAGIIDRVRS